jgi:hypothetical protein
MIVKRREINYSIFSVAIEEHKNIKSNLLHLIDKQNKTTLNGDAQFCESDWTVDIGQEREYFKYLRVYIDKYIESIIIDNSPKDIELNFEYQNVWFQRYVKNHYHDWHNHEGTWAIIYFLELSDPDLSTEFFIPFEKDIVKINVEEGDLLIFPGNLWHRSSPNMSSKTKTVIVSNIMITL